MKYISIFIFSVAAVFGIPHFCFCDEAKVVEESAKSIPGRGLISQKIHFNGITISDFRFENNKNYIFAHPEEEFTVYFNYKVDASKLKTLHLNHVIIGLHDDGPQKCVLSSLGVKNSGGNAKVVLKAPKKEGVFQVRFCLAEGFTDNQAKKAWWSKKHGHSAKTIVGIVISKAK